MKTKRYTLAFNGENKSIKSWVTVLLYYLVASRGYAGLSIAFSRSEDWEVGG